MARGELFLKSGGGKGMPGRGNEDRTSAERTAETRTIGRRGCGILLHVTSLPSRYGIGDLGPSAYRFVDFLEAAGMKYWQILPLGPTRTADDNSPYRSSSAFAGNTLLISPELMERDGFLDARWRKTAPDFPGDRTDFSAVCQWKQELFHRAFRRSAAALPDDGRFCAFCAENADWIDDFALFQSLAGHYGNRRWDKWPRGLKYREDSALARAGLLMQESTAQEKFLQYVFSRQWEDLWGYCRERSISIIGDLPLYVSYQSADVWAHPHLFLLDGHLQPSAVAGVPPDYFSSTGQIWKNPLYRWEEHRRTGFSWWVRRIGRNIALFDRIRIDHFRGLVAFWKVSARARTAARGRWVRAPADALLHTLKTAFPDFPFIAEDLGLITPAVTAIRKKYRIPGTRVMQFAVSDFSPGNSHALSRVTPDLVLYTGTHDNPPVRGWFEEFSGVREKRQIARWAGNLPSPEELPGIFIRSAMMSAAETVIIPVQDLLGLGAEARMNSPGTDAGNWQWRLTPGQTKKLDPDGLRDLVIRSGR